MSPTEREFRQNLVDLLPRLRRFARSLSGSVDIAEDLLQTSLERAIRSASSYDTTRRLDSWLFKITQNAWFDMRKDLAKRRHASLEDVAAPFEDARTSTEARDELRRTLAAFGQLPEEQRAVLALVVLEGFTYKDAAETLDIPVGTVMSRLARGRAAIAAVVRVESPTTEVREPRR